GWEPFGRPFVLEVSARTPRKYFRARRSHLGSAGVNKAIPSTMPRIPIFKLGRAPEHDLPPKLGSYTPELTLDGLQLGVDNLRHDVHLSSRFVELARARIARLIM